MLILNWCVSIVRLWRGTYKLWVVFRSSSFSYAQSYSRTVYMESTHGKKLYHHHYRALLKTAGFLPTPINECVINLPICNASYIIYSLVSRPKFHVYELSGNYFNKIYCWTNHIYRYNFEGADNERTKVDRSIIYFIFYSTIERWNWLWKREYSETLI